MKTLLRINCVTALFIATLTAAAPAAHAASQTIIHVPPTVIDIGDGRLAVFEAELAFCRDHSIGDDSFVQMVYRDNAEVLRFAPAWAHLDSLTGAVLVVLFDTDFDPAAAGPASGNDGDVILSVIPVPPLQIDTSVRVDLSGPAFKNETPAPAPFEVPGSVDIWQHSDNECASVDFGQEDAQVFLESPLEGDVSLPPQGPPSPITDIEVATRINTRQEARGFIVIYENNEPKSYETMFGAVFVDDNGEPNVLTYGLLEDREGQPFSNQRHILRATAVPEVDDAPAPPPPPPPPPPGGGSTVNPGCLVWDLINENTGQVIKQGEIDVREIELTDVD